jgi:hypothetical protein
MIPRMRGHAACLLLGDFIVEIGYGLGTTVLLIIKSAAEIAIHSEMRRFVRGAATRPAEANMKETNRLRPHSGVSQTPSDTGHHAVLETRL